MATTTIPGLPGGPLITDYPVNINLVPAWRTQQRPGITARTPRRNVQHGSGNPTSSAEGEIQYIVDGAGGRQASYHLSTDWDSACIGVPLNEVTWQAADGSGPGNMNGVSNELAENKAAWADPAKKKRMIYIAADMMGRIAARLNITKPEYHWTFNYNDRVDRHRCPNFILFATGHVETQAAYEKQWYASKADEIQRMGGGGGIIIPKPAFIKNDIVATTDRLNIRPVAGTSQTAVATLDADTQAIVQEGPTSADGYEWYRISTPTVTGWGAADWLQKVGHVSEGAKPSPVTALLGTDLKKNDTAEGITSDDAGTDFVFVADVIEVTADAGLDAYVWADRSKVLRHYNKGERFIGAWLFQYKDDEYFYLTCAPDWERIPYTGTKRISDAPLIPGEEYTS